MGDVAGGEGLPALPARAPGGIPAVTLHFFSLLIKVHLKFFYANAKRRASLRGLPTASVTGKKSALSLSLFSLPVLILHGYKHPRVTFKMFIMFRLGFLERKTFPTISQGRPWFRAQLRRSCGPRARGFHPRPDLLPAPSREALSMPRAHLCLA